MGHCLQQFVLMYHLLCYHDNTFIEQRSNKVSKNDRKLFIFIKFMLCEKIDMKYEISVSELTPPPDFSLIPPKIEKLVKSWTLTPKTKNGNYKRPVTKSSILLRFWIEFVTYLHATKFCFN